MRINSIYAKNLAPVKLFEVNNLSDLIIIAGPNGVGKSRLVFQIINYIQNLNINPDIKLEIEATTSKEEKEWQKKKLDTSIQEDMTILRNMLQKNRSRRNWESSIIFFESDRSIQKLQPYAFTWEMPDPDEEQIDWTITFREFKNRFPDTVHSIFRKIEHQKRALGSQAINLKNKGKTSMQLKFSDPIEPFKNAFSQLLAPKSLINPSPQDQNLRYDCDGNDNEYDFNSLSSGEREVVNIIFDFILRKPKNCIIVFDEPELHLHPELSYKLIQTLRSSGLNNQFILCTHSPDIISSSLDNSVIFLAPAKDETFNQAILVSEDDQTNQALRLIGHSIGIVALGKKIVLIEGKDSSLDKQVYGSIIKDRFPNIVLVPSGGKDEIRSFSNIFENVLSKSIWGVDFFMLTDRDILPPFPEMNEIKEGHNRFKILDRYHLENYFLNENIWAQIFSTMDSEESWLTDSTKIKEYIKEAASLFIPYTISLTVSSLIRTTAGNINIMVKKCHETDINVLEKSIVENSNEEIQRINQLLEQTKIKKYINEISSKLKLSFEDENDEWKKLIPGKPILNKFISSTGLGLGRAKNLYINEIMKKGHNDFDEIIEIFNGFNNVRPSL